MADTTRAHWWIPTGLILLGAVPVLAGSLRVAQMAGATDGMAAEARFSASPVPILVHVVSAIAFIVLGAFQFAPRLRGGRWHRRAGSVLIPAGLAAALSALWMAAYYPLPEQDSEWLTAFRVLFGSMMIAAILLGAAALRRRDFARHGDWMTRAYAIGIAAGTQAVFVGLWEGFAGAPGPRTRALILGAAWVFDLAVAEWAVRRRRNNTPTRVPVHSRA